MLSFELYLASLLLGFNYSFNLYLASLASLLLCFLLLFTFYLLCEYAYKGVTSISWLNLKSLAFKVRN